MNLDEQLPKSKNRNLLMRILPICFFILLFSISLSAQERLLLTWYDATVLGIQGKGWTDTKTPFDRLPVKAEKLVPEGVWARSLNSAGLHVSFATNSPIIVVRWRLRNPSISSPYLSSMSVAGLDLYVRQGDKWFWAATKPPKSYPETTETFLRNLSPELREYLLYLPIYNGVEKVEIGVAEVSKFGKAIESTTEKPIVIYGTSIVQGSAASRPGMTYVSQLARRLNRPVINLGFSGLCHMEHALAELLAELDPAMYVVDCLPNMLPKEIKERTVPLVKTIREKHPDTPIVLIENLAYPQGRWNPGVEKSVELKNKILSDEYAKLRRESIPNIYYIKNDGLLSNEGNATVDGVHPTDLGFWQMTNTLEPILRAILTRSETKQGAKEKNDRNRPG
jgi:hypothetical protein